jgi:amino acid transporter
VSGNDPNYLYLLFAGVGEFLIVMGIFMASLAVIFYFRKNKQYNFSTWSTLIAPALGAIGIAFVLIMAVFNFNALTAASGVVSVILFSTIMLIAIGTFAYSKYLQKVKPEIYERIGRQDAADL